MNFFSLDSLPFIPHPFAIYLRNQVVCSVEFPIFLNILLRLFNMFPDFCVCSELIVSSINLVTFSTELIKKEYFIEGFIYFLLCCFVWHEMSTCLSFCDKIGWVVSDIAILVYLIWSSLLAFHLIILVTINDQLLDSLFH